MNTLEKLNDELQQLPLIASFNLADLAEARGRQELFTHQSPQKLKALREHAIVESVVSSNRIEGVEVEQARVRTLVFGKPQPRDRDEEEVRGYRQALKKIHEHGARMVVDEAIVLELHRSIRGDIWDAGRYKEKEGDIIETYPDGRRRIRFKTVSAAETPAALRGLIQSWNQSMRERRIPPLVALAVFNLDFLCIHPFRDGNGRVSRLLLLLQLYQLGFEVGRYISLERLIEENKERYYETLDASSKGWHQGKQDPWPYVNYLLFILKQAYKEFESRLTQLKTPKGSKTQQVENAIASLPGEFTFAELQRACPNVSRDMIRAVLRRMKTENKIVSLGHGPGARWKKGNTPKKR
ncbi:Fic family protein [bacterium]|nr:Fic family protein [bacterium]